MDEVANNRDYHIREKFKKLVFAGEPPCYLCGLDIDYNLPSGLSGSPEMDDIIPVSKGGNPLDRENLRAVHKSCNIRRNNLPVDVAIRNEKNRSKNSRVW